MMPVTDALADTVISGDLLAQLPDLGPCELVEGRIVRMSPTGPKHAKLEQRFAWLLQNFLEAHPLGELYVGEVGIYTGRAPDTVRGADIAFVSHERLKQQDPDAPFLTVLPEIVIEILSPNDRAQELEKKVGEYLKAGAVEVWIADPENRTLHRRRAEAGSSELLDQTQQLTTPVLPGFELQVTEIFRGL